ncbi:hypothetical protein D3C71_1632690 [compost metagenome]
MPVHLVQAALQGIALQALKTLHLGEPGVHGGQQQVVIDRLDQVVVRTRARAAQHMLAIAERRQQQEWNAGMCIRLAQLGQQIQAALAG